MNSSVSLRPPWRSAVLAMALATGACGSSSSGGPDAEAGLGPRDAQIIDAVTVFDAPGDAVGAGDGDARLPPVSPTCDIGSCDPRREGSCDAGAVCEIRRGTTACSEEPSVGLMEGMNCYSPQDCAPGLVCSLGRALEVGLCRRPCCPRGSVEDCRGGERCAYPARDPANAWAWTWGHCVPPRPCDPLASGSVCDLREACYIVGAEGQTDCMNAGGRMIAEACERQNDCAPGLYCARAGDGVGACVRVCSLADDRSVCLPDEGRCVEYSHTPDGLGLCTEEPRSS